MNLSEFLQGFADPPAEYGLQPFWFWNGDLDPAELLRQVDLMHEQGVTGFVIHARFGLKVPYLSEEWFDRVRVVLEHARRLGMHVWIYDEENWASGYAGGRVLARDPSLSPQCLVVERIWIDEGENYLDWPKPWDDPRGRGDVVAAQAVQVFSKPRERGPFEWTGPHQKEAPWYDQGRHEISFGKVLQLSIDEPPPPPPPPPPKPLDRFKKKPPPIPREDMPSFFRNPGGRWLICVFRRATTEWYPAYSSEYYIDVLRKETAPLFLETTHEEYRRRFRDYFGDTIQGFFVDEPGLYNNFWDRNRGSIAWTEDFAAEFQARLGYDLREQLIYLYEKIPHDPAHFEWIDQDAKASGEQEGSEEAVGAPDATPEPVPGSNHSMKPWEQVRFDYYDFVGQLMQERFMQPLADWCEQHGLQHTGHLMLEEFMVTMARYGANPFRQLSTLHVPGVDRIDEVYEKVAERIASSVAHLTGRKRVISETYALIGWKLAPPYMKEIFDYQAARGVNLLCPHAFYYTIEGDCKDECPPSEFFQNPWWPHFKPFADYVRRVCFALSQGKPVKDFLLYYPIETVFTQISPEWPQSMTAGPTEHWQLSDRWHPAVEMDVEFVKLCVRLENAGFDFDLADYTFLERAQVVSDAASFTESVRNDSDGSLESRPSLKIGDVEVDTLLLAFADRLAPEAAKKIREFEEAGGTVIRFCSAASPVGREDTTRINGLQLENAPLQLIETLRRFASHSTLDFSAYDRFAAWQRTPSTHHPAREQFYQEGHMLNTCRRRLGDGTHIQFVSQPPSWLDSPESPASFGLRADAQHVLLLDPVTGHTGSEWPGAPRLTKWTQAEIAMEYGSALFAISSAVTAEEQSDWKNSSSVDVSAPWEMLWPEEDWHPVDSLKTWAALGRPFYSGTARYRTVLLADELPGRLWLLLDVLETARLWVNGQDLGPAAFPPYIWDIAPSLKVGTNTIEVEVANTLQGELERKERAAGLLDVTFRFG